MSTTDTDVQNLVVNKLTLSQYTELKNAGTVSATESYEITDIDSKILDFYGTCTTAAGTQAKVVTCPGFILQEGISIRVKFTNNQDYNGAPTLNVNNTGAKTIVSKSGTNAIRYCWMAGEVVAFTYDGTNWIMQDGGIATTTYYGVTKLQTSTTSTGTGLAATPASINNLVQNMIEPYDVYSTTGTYAVGDRVRYNNNAWECNTAISTAEAWTEAHWTKIDPIQTQLDDLSTSLATVATSGSYNDLSNKPTIPTVNDATVTFTQGGTTKGTITLNQSNNQTIAFDAGGGGGSSTLAGLTDVTLTSLSEGQSLVYDATNNLWKNSSSNIPFYATYNQTTYNEIAEAVNQGRSVILSRGYYRVPLNTITTDSWGFSYWDGKDKKSAWVSTNDTWTTGITSFQETAGLVTSMSASSTNTQYPSAKCVYDAIQANDSNVVKLNGNQIINDVKTFTSPIPIDTSADDGRVVTKLENITLGTDPTINAYGGFKTVDSNDVQFANCNCSYSTTGKIGCNFWISRSDSGTAVSGTLGIYIDKNGTSAYTQAPTPDVSANNAEIATTAYINTKFQIVSTLPASPDANTYYFIPAS